MINIFRSFFRHTPRFPIKIPQKTLSFVLFLAIYPDLKLSFSATNDNKPEKTAGKSKLRDLMKKEDAKIRSTLHKGIDLFESGSIDDSLEEFLQVILMSDTMDGPINHCSGLASYYLGEIHKAKGEFDSALSYFERTVECLLFVKENSNNNRSAVNFSKEEVNNLYKNTVNSIIELEKLNVVGPLSSFIRKVSILEEFKNIQKDPIKYQDQLGTLGVIYFQMADILLVQKLKNAQEMKLKGLEYFEKNTKNEREKMVPVYIEMGQFFRRLNSLKMAEEYYLKALPLVEKLEKNVRAAVEFEVFYKGLAKVYAETDEYEKGVNCMKKTVDLIENLMKEKISLSEKVAIYYETGCFLKNLKKEQETLQFWEKAGKILEEQGDTQAARRRAWAIYKEIGELCEGRKDLEAAKKAYEKSLGFVCKVYGEDSPMTKEAREHLEKIRKSNKKGWF